MNPNGAFAYVSTADANTLTAYAMDPITGKLTASTATPPGATDTEPLFAAVDPSGRFAFTANYSGDDVSAFTLDPVTGALTAVGGAPFKAGLATQAIAIIATIQ
jgi:6-phosphogluconolactonase